MLDFAEEVLINNREVTVEDIEELQRDLSLVEDDDEVIAVLEALMLNDSYLKAANEYMGRDEDVDYRQGLKANITSGFLRIKNFWDNITSDISTKIRMENYEYNCKQEALPKYKEK